jgi:hypothetical protein
MPRKHATLIVAAHRVAEARRIVANQSSPSNGGSQLLNSLLNLYWFEFAGKGIWLESFRTSFRFILTLTKTAAPVTKFAPSWWIDYAQQWARDAGVPGVIRSLLPAVVTSGDIQYSFDDRSAFWLDPYRSSGRVVDAQAWRKLLNGGDLIAPTKLNTFVDHSIGLQRSQSVW